MKNKNIIYLTLVSVLIIGVLFFWKVADNQKNGRYYAVYTGKKPFIDSDDSFLIEDNKIKRSTDDPGIKLDSDLKIKDGTVDDGMTIYAKKDSDLYIKTKKKIVKLKKDLKQQKKEIKKIKSDYDKQLKVSTKSVQTDFLNLIKGKYVGNKKFKVAEIIYTISLNFNGDNLTYEVDEDHSDSIPDIKSIFNDKIENTHRSIQSKEVAWIREPDRVLAEDIEDYEIESNMEYLKSVQKFHSQVDKIKSDLENDDLSLTKAKKDSLLEQLEKLKKINTWSEYKAETKVTKAVFYLVGKGTSERDGHVTQVADRSQPMLISEPKDDTMVVGYAFNDIGGIDIDPYITYKKV